MEISQNDKVLSLIQLGKEDKSSGVDYLVMGTKKGIIKKTALEGFQNVRKSGLIAITLKKGDLLKKVCKSKKTDDIMLITKKGKSIRFKGKEIREMGRQAAGVKGIAIKKDDEVIGMEIIPQLEKKEKQYLLVLSENGYGKRTEVSEYRSQTRGGAGIKTANVTPKTGNIIFSSMLSGEEEDLIVISQKGQVIRSKISSIPILGRSTQGVRIMRLEQGDKVASAACM